MNHIHGLVRRREYRAEKTGEKIEHEFQCMTMRHGTIQYSKVQCNTVQYSTVQYDTAQSSAIRISTIQYKTVQNSNVAFGKYSMLQ